MCKLGVKRRLASLRCTLNQDETTTQYNTEDAAQRRRTAVLDHISSGRSYPNLPSNAWAIPSFSPKKKKTHNYGACTPAYAGESPWNGGLHRPSQSALSRRVPTKSKSCQGRWCLCAAELGHRFVQGSQEPEHAIAAQQPAARRTKQRVTYYSDAACVVVTFCLERHQLCGFAGQPEHWPNRSGKGINQSATPLLSLLLVSSGCAQCQIRAGRSHYSPVAGSEVGAVDWLSPLPICMADVRAGQATQMILCSQKTTTVEASAAEFGVFGQ